jgi:hypothetical protein
VDVDRDDHALADLHAVGAPREVVLIGNARDLVPNRRVAGVSAAALTTL